MEPDLHQIPPSPQSTVCSAKGSLPTEANADPDTSLLEIASAGTVLHRAAFVPQILDCASCSGMGELLGTGCKLLCLPEE